MAPASVLALLVGWTLPLRPPRSGRLRRRGARHPDPAAGAGRPRARAQGSLQAQPFSRAARRCAARAVADRPAAGAARAPGVVDVRCDRTNAVAAVRQPPQPARVDDGGTGAGERAARPGRLLPSHGRRGRHRRRRDRAGDRGAGERPAGGAVRVAVDPVACPRASREPSVASREASTACRRRCSRAAAHRAPRMALLRHVRHRRRSHAAAGQFPGGPAAGARPPHLTDQSRPVPALDRHRARLRLGRDARRGRATGGDARCNGGAGAISRALLQLV